MAQRRAAKKTQGFKDKMRDKQIKPRREDEKDSISPEEKVRRKMLFDRYGIVFK